MTIRNPITGKAEWFNGDYGEQWDPFREWIKGWIKKAMLDLDEKFLDLKRNGKSLREIGSVLQISHEAARKRLKALAGKHCLSTRKENKGLTASTSDNELQSTSPNPHLSRLPEDSEMCVNQLSTSEAPYSTPPGSLNSSGTLSDRPPECMKGVFQGVCLESDDLAAAIRQFLQTNGVEVYEMATSVEGFQARQGKQTVRFYVQRER